MAAAKSRKYRLGLSRNVIPQKDEIRRIKTMTRCRFSLVEDSVVFVAEVDCTRVGCPPLQTVVVFWTEDGTRRQFKMFKPLEQIEIDDFPPAWLASALASFERDERGCC